MWCASDFYRFRKAAKLSWSLARNCARPCVAPREEEPAEGAGRRPERGARGRAPRSSTTEKAHKAWGEPPSPGHPTQTTGGETEVPVAASGGAGGDLGRGRAGAAGAGGGPQKDTVLSFADDASVEGAAKGKTRKASWDEGGNEIQAVKNKRKGTFVNTKGDYLPWKTKFIYAMPGIATISVTFFIAVYLADFYVSLGVSLSFVGFFTALARAFDVITDPLMGWITDNARTKYGRRRPFIGVGCFFY